MSLVCPRSRQSLFGGSLSTAKDSVARDYIPAELREKPKPHPVAKKQRLDPECGLNSSRLAAAPPRKPETKKPVDYSDFASLGSETACTVGLSDACIRKNSLGSVGANKSFAMILTWSCRWCKYLLSLLKTRQSPCDVPRRQICCICNAF